MHVFGAVPVELENKQFYFATNQTMKFIRNQAFCLRIGCRNLSKLLYSCQNRRFDALIIDLKLLQFSKEQYFLT